jgi:hypothetical protein
MIVGIVGWIGSGKDTIADYLVNFHGFRRDSFAATLKDAVSSVFGWDREMLEGRTAASREWREKVDQWWATRLNMPNLTPRLVLQLWGTEVCRKAFHDDIWIASLENKLRAYQDNIVISDCRFTNEIKAIKNVGGKVIWVRRGPLPDWYDRAVLATDGLMKEPYMNDIHISEWNWVGTNFDAVISNEGTIDELYTEIKNLVVKDLVAN